MTKKIKQQKNNTYLIKMVGKIYYQEVNLLKHMLKNKVHTV